MDINNTGGKRNLWFTNPQNDLLVKLKKELNMNNAEVVRAGMEALANQYGLEYKDTSPKRSRG